MNAKKEIKKSVEYVGKMKIKGNVWNVIKDII